MKETDAIVELIQRTARGVFVGITVSILILIHNPEAVWSVPLGVIIGLCTQAVALTKKSEKENKVYWKTLFNSESDLCHWEIIHDSAEEKVVLHWVPEEDYSEKDIKIKLSYEEFEDLIQFLKRIEK